jgi:hypothetical protein
MQVNMDPSKLLKVIANSVAAGAAAVAHDTHAMHA